VVGGEIGASSQGTAGTYDPSESVNAYVNRLLRAAVVGPGSLRHMWKAAAVVDGRLMPRGMLTGRPRSWALDFKTAVNTRAGYAAEMVSTGREER